MTAIRKSFGILALLVFVLACDVSSDEPALPPPNFDPIGLFDLVEVNISPAQDLNEDGTASTNLLDELDCLTGTLLIDGDLVWTFEQVNLAVTPITGDDFEIDCTDSTTATGTWFANETTVTFSGDPVLTTLQIENDGARLVAQVGQDLPGFQSFVYERRIVN